MAKYIDADKVHIDYDELRACENYIAVGQYLMGAINETPTADVVEVRHGEWINGNPNCPVCGEDKFKDLDADIWADWQPPYCPNCGAKMDKEN